MKRYFNLNICILKKNVLLVALSILFMPVMIYSQATPEGKAVAGSERFACPYCKQEGKSVWLIECAYCSAADFWKKHVCLYHSKECPNNPYDKNQSNATTTTAAPGHEFDNTISQAIAGGITGQLSAANAVGFVALGVFGNMLFAPKKVDPSEQQRIQQQQQLQLAADQLNKSGIYLFKQKNYAGAINEFEKALAKTPGDQNIIKNLALAKQQLNNTAVAGQNSNALSQLLGTTPAESGQLNFDQLTHSTTQSPNSSALSLVNLDPTKTTVDPAAQKNNSPGTSTQVTEAKNTLQELDKVLGSGQEKTAKQQLDDFAKDILQPQPDAKTLTENKNVNNEQSIKAIDEILNQPAIVTPGEDLKDAPANKTAKSGDGSKTEPRGAFGEITIKPDLKPADRVTPGQDKKADSQLLSAAAAAKGNSDLTINYDVGGAKSGGSLVFGNASDPATFSAKVKNDPRMIAAMKQLNDLKADRFKLETEVKQLTDLRNSKTDINEFAELDKKLKQKEKDYNDKLKTVSDATTVVEKLHRTIDDEVETNPPALVKPTKN